MQDEQARNKNTTPGAVLLTGNRETERDKNFSTKMRHYSARVCKQLTSPKMTSESEMQYLEEQTALNNTQNDHNLTTQRSVAKILKWDNKITTNACKISKLTTK